MKQPFTHLLLLCFFFCYSTSVFAQHYSGAQAQKIYARASQVTIHPKRHNISFIRLDPQTPVSSANAEAWLRTDILKLRAFDKLVQYQVIDDKIGFIHTRYHQYYKGIPVEYGTYYIHNKDGHVISANGEWYDGINVSVKASLSSSKAHQAAAAYLHGQESPSQEVKENDQLVVLPLNNDFKLAFKCDVYTLKPLQRAWIYVDAKSGTVLKETNAIETIDVPGSAETQYSGKKEIIADSFATNSFRLREYTRGAGVETYDYLTGSDYFDSDNSWVTSDIMVRVAYDAHYGAEATYDFYFNEFGWSSVDGDGQTILKSYLNNNGAGSINAFWDQNANTMNYGQGDVSGGVTPLTSLEICGHELTHGVTQFSSNLTYAGESGGLNESFSDIAGATIRFLNDPDIATWYLGDQINYIFRNMADPKQYSQPDTYGGQYWSSFADVHILSGVQNYWYYLLVEGGSGVNDNGDSYSILGIGLDDASQIALRNDIFYLTASSDYAEARDMAIQAAVDLFGDCSPQVIQTTNAWHAVGIGDLYQNAVTAIFSVGQTNYCSVPTTVQFTNNSINATSYLWDFGDGSTSTDISPSHTYTQPGIYTLRSSLWLLEVVTVNV